MTVSIQEIIVKRHKRKWENYYKLKEVINAAYLSKTGHAKIVLNSAWPWRHNIYTDNLTLYYSYMNERKGRCLIIKM